jgi:hypothetical protein
MGASLENPHQHRPRVREGMQYPYSAAMMLQYSRTALTELADDNPALETLVPSEVEGLV